MKKSDNDIAEKICRNVVYTAADAKQTLKEKLMKERGISEEKAEEAAAAIGRAAQRGKKAAKKPAKPAKPAKKAKKAPAPGEVVYKAKHIPTSKTEAEREKGAPAVSKVVTKKMENIAKKINAPEQEVSHIFQWLQDPAHEVKFDESDLMFMLPREREGGKWYSSPKLDVPGMITIAGTLAKLRRSKTIERMAIGTKEYFRIKR